MAPRWRSKPIRRCPALYQYHSPGDAPFEKVPRSRYSSRARLKPSMAPAKMTTEKVSTIETSVDTTMRLHNGTLYAFRKPSHEYILFHRCSFGPSTLWLLDDVSMLSSEYGR